MRWSRAMRRRMRGELGEKNEGKGGKKRIRREAVVGNWAEK